MSSYLLLQQCTACLVRLTRIVFVMGGKWPCSCCFMGCRLQDLFNIACRKKEKTPKKLPKLKRNKVLKNEIEAILLK